MKKYCFILVMALVGIVMGCNHQNTPQTTDAPPTPEVSKVASLPANIADCDMTMLDNGKLYLYNTATSVMTPYEAEKDSVVNVLFEPDMVYYCVAVDNHILLRCIDLTQPDPQPKQLVDWGVPYEDCVTETYGTVSSLECYRARKMLGLWYDFSWDSYSLTKQKLYNLETGEITEYDWEVWQKEEQALQEEEEQTEENYHYTSTADELQEYLKQKDGQYYMTDGNDVCLTDQIDCASYASSPEYYSGPEFEYVSSSPDNLKVLYMIIVEWGDFPHGILAISSTDGKLQMPLEDTDCTGFMAEWLDDGSLVYVGEEPLSPDHPDYDANWHYRAHCIKRVYPDNHVEIIAHCGEFQMKRSPVNK